MGVLNQALAAILVELLRYFQSREDLKRMVQLKIEAAGLKSANDALGYKVRATGNVRASDLRVSDPTVSIKLPGGDSTHDSKPPTGPV